MIKNGKPVQTDEENIEEIGKLAEIFLSRLPILESLEIA